MSLKANSIKAPKSSRVEQDLISIGMHRGRVVQVIDLGRQPRRAYKGVTKDPVNQIWVTYEFVDLMMKDEKGEDVEGQPRWLSERVNLFPMSQENATSTKRMENLDPENELDGDWGRVVDTPCLIQVTHSKNKKYANIGSVSPPMVGSDTPELADPERGLFFDLDEPNLDVFNGLPDFLKEDITSKNVEFAKSKLAKALAGEPEVEEAEVEEEYVDEEVDEEEIY